MANILYQSLHPGLEEDFLGGDGTFAMMPGPNREGMPYNTSELNAPEYSTDDFRMFSFKVARCSKRYVHDWRSCPFAHPTENARRRDPRLTRYLPVPCPDYKRGICLRGDACSYSHGVYECWLHPAKYRMQLCKEGPHCRRPVCFFAHSVVDLRQPTHLWGGGNSSSEGVPAGNPERSQVQMPPAGPTVTAPTATSVAAMLMQHAAGGGIPSYVRSAGGSGSSHQGSATGSLLSQSANGSAGSGSCTDGQYQYRLQPAEELQNNNGGGVDLLRAPSLEASAAASGSNNSLCLPGLPSPPRSPTAEDAFGPVTPAPLAGDPPVQLPAAAAAPLLGVPSSTPVRTSSLDLGALSVQPDPATLAPPPQRMSLDSVLQVQQQAHQQRHMAAAAVGGGGDTNSAAWSQSLAASASAAAALAGIPVNERPMLPNHGPRMSNAVARQLGLAPVKPPTVPGAPPTAADPRMAPVLPRSSAAGASSPAASPPAASFDGLLQAINSRASREQQAQQQLAVAALKHSALAGGPPPAAMPAPYETTALPYVAAGNGMLAGNGNGVPAMAFSGPEAFSVYPAALAHLAAANALGPEHNGVQVHASHHPQLEAAAGKAFAAMYPNQQPPPHGNDAAVARLITSLQRHWALAQGQEGAVIGGGTDQCTGGGYGHAGYNGMVHPHGQHGHHTDPHAAPLNAMPRRPSLDGMPGMSALPHAPPFYLANDLEGIAPQRWAPAGC